MMYQHDFNTIAKAFARAKITGQPPILVLAEELQNKYPSFNPVKFMDTYEQQLYHTRYAEEQKKKGGKAKQKNTTVASGSWVRGRNRKRVSIQA